MIDNFHKDNICNFCETSCSEYHKGRFCYFLVATRLFALWASPRIRKKNKGKKGKSQAKEVWIILSSRFFRRTKTFSWAWIWTSHGGRTWKYDINTFRKLFLSVIFVPHFIQETGLKYCTYKCGESVTWC